MKFILTKMIFLYSVVHIKCIHFIDIPKTVESSITNNHSTKSKSPINVNNDTNIEMQKHRDSRRNNYLRDTEIVKEKVEDEKDSNLKAKITVLVQQTIHDTERKIVSIKSVKEAYNEKAPYKIGFILSMIKKSKEVMNELFNVAVKHRDEWMALEQLKFFELIVHANVDSNNLLRQLVEIHLQNLNATGSANENKRVILI